MKEKQGCKSPTKLDPDGLQALWLRLSFMSYFLFFFSGFYCKVAARDSLQTRAVCKCAQSVKSFEYILHAEYFILV